MLELQVDDLPRTWTTPRPPPLDWRRSMPLSLTPSTAPETARVATHAFHARPDRLAAAGAPAPKLDHAAGAGARHGVAELAPTKARPHAHEAAAPGGPAEHQLPGQPDRKGLPKPDGPSELAHSASKQQQRQDAAAHKHAVEQWKGVTDHQLAHGLEPELHQALRLAKAAQRSGKQGDASTSSSQAHRALSMLDDAEASIDTWKRAHPGATTPERLVKLVTLVRTAITEVPKFDSLVGTPDGEPIYIGGHWPDWSLPKH
jgi:hypothetical protein